MTTPSRTTALSRDPSFRADQGAIALFVAQLDDQSRRLEKAISELDAAALARQPAPGRNSVGMLVAHIALTEVFWMSVAVGVATDQATAEAACREATGHGLDDDGMPCPPGGGPPAVLAGWDAARYVGLLRRARAYLRRHVATWTDADLAVTGRYSGREQFTVTREWVLYHLLEHFAQHAGQVGLVRALAAQPAS